MIGKKPRDQDSGFTLMEVVIGLALSSLIGSIIFAVWTFTLTFTRRGSLEVEAQQHGRIALTVLAGELREAAAGASSLAVWSSADGQPVDAVGFLGARSEEDRRTFSIESGGPSWQTAVYYVHDRAAGMLRRVARPWEGHFSMPPTGEGRVVARGVREVRFAHRNDLITITLRVAAGRREVTLETTVLPRN